MAEDDIEVTVPILLLGDAVGKSTFLSRLSLGVSSKPSDPLPTLRDEAQPFIFNVSPGRAIQRNAAQRKIYRLEISDTSSPTHYSLLRPTVIVLCYSVASKRSLTSVHTTWKYLVETHFSYDESAPIMLLGLQRDLRRANDLSAHGITETPAKWAPKSKGGYEINEDDSSDRSVLPQEGLRVAQEMRCDRYAECSAVTGELCREVFEDIVQMAATASRGYGEGKSEGFQCCLM